MEPKSNFRRFRPQFIAFAILAVAIVIFMTLKATKPEQPKVEVKQKVWPVKVIKVSVGEVTPVQTLYGTVESNALVTAASPVTGVIETVLVKAGDEVGQGEKLVALSDADIKLPYQIAKADVADTSAQLKLQDLAYQANLQRLENEKKLLEIKQNDVKRNAGLIKKDLVSESTFDKSKEALVKQEYSVVGAKLLVEENKTKVAQLQARLTKAKANLEQAKLNLARGVVNAPYKLRVAEVAVAKGDRVAVNAPMVSFYALDSLELRAQIPASQLKTVYQSLQAGKQLQAQFQLDGKRFALPLKRLAGQATTSGVDAFFAMPEILKITRPGDLLKVQLLGEPVSSAFAVPYSAVYGSDRIYIAEKGELQAKKIKLVGETRVNEELWALVQAELPNNAFVVTTHLPNAISGLKISLVGADK